MSAVVGTALPVLAAAWVILVVVAAWSSRPQRGVTARLPAGTSAAGCHSSDERGRQGRLPISGLAPSLVVGRAVLRLAPARRGQRRPAALDQAAAVRLGRAVWVGGFSLFLLPLLAAVAVGVAMWCAPLVPRWRHATDRQQQLIGELPEVIDLFRLAAASGFNVTLAVAAVARRAPPLMGKELARIVDQVAVGGRLADLLSDLAGDLGEPVRPLVGVLLDSERYGTPLADALDRLAAEARLQRRHRAEEAARRLPVKLLFPLVLLVLPAFGLLTLAPLVAGALRGLRL